MRAIVIEEPGKVTFHEIPMPERKPGEALLKPLYGGICGSDLGSYRGTFAYFSYPRIPGHEFSAEIVDIDENDLGLHKGMVVVCNPYFNCGKCHSCLQGHVNACMSNETMGVQREGAFAEYITMPLERIYDGKGMDPKVLAAIEPLCISYHGVKRGKVHAGDKVLIVGAGTIGVLAAVSAKQTGAEVYVADIAKDKLEYAERFGIDGVIWGRGPEDYQKAMDELTGGSGFDVTIEAVGLPSTFQTCIDMAAFGGRMVQVGVGKKNQDFNFTMLQKKELNVYGSRNALKADFMEAIELVKAGKIPLDQVITNVYKFDDAPRAFKELDEDSAHMLKVILDFT